MLPDRLQYFWEHFWNDQKCDQIWNLGPHNHQQNNSKNIRKLRGTSLNTFFISENLKLWLLGNVCVPNFLKFCNLKIWEFASWKPKILKMKIRNVEIGNLKMKIQTRAIKPCAFWTFEICKLNTLKIEELQNGTCEHWQFEN